MPDIRPFKALRYNPSRFGQDLSALIAPPYDVLDDRDKARLLARNERNIVAVDLPHVPPKSAGPDEVYARAAETLRQWLSEGTLIQEDAPAIYVYHQQYQHGGRSFVRKMFFARMRLEEFGAGTVFPHERTFGGPKEDRLKLMQASRAQLSAVFGLYSDPANAISGLLSVDESRPDAVAEMDGVSNRLWVLREAGVIDAMRAKMATLPVYIADGHHRYGTALIYRKLLAEQGPLPEDHPAQFVLVGFCAMEDPGCVILPTHRVISGFTSQQSERILDALAAGIDLRVADATRSTPEEWLAASTGAAQGAQDARPSDIAVYSPHGGQLYLGTFTKRSVLDTLAADRTPPYRRLDLAYLHDYVINELIARGVLNGTAPTIQYTHAADEAVKLAKDTGGIAFITRPCTMDDLRAVSEAGDLMPQKSTFFYPKLATGLVVNPLE
ncbi:MAG TPA: DUF1015 domain-containing protein [Phycisphaerae bacterium]|nr:DUF1015 domain-containing protein [Phycisphaerae bacterium]HOB75882.1 DUF1015 domain-containing protein [Phycisphaerae bacterium]HOJ54432.1 DUF1015 domain-containing protein [Phycisphaerae bacterium]HOL26253.1 DUF1015 domain-containing protein [Phycisphaerae bacterium]HPP20778.1 DUF1015 domain-containing protein [Phycisphaerae bacterium]